MFLGGCVWSQSQRDYVRFKRLLDINMYRNTFESIGVPNSITQQQTYVLYAYRPRHVSARVYNQSYCKGIKNYESRSQPPQLYPPSNKAGWGRETSGT